jgi:hypothetical protein
MQCIVRFIVSSSWNQWFRYRAETQNQVRENDRLRIYRYQ